MFYIVGLGNPGEEYEGTRHNTGRMAVEFFEKKNEISLKKLSIIHSNEFMNNSGKAVAKFIKPKIGKNKSQENLIVVHDDLDLPLGTFKISYNKGVGGHRGLDSVAKAVKTLEFVRVRVGISGATAKGRAKKPEGEQKVLDFILGKFTPKQNEELKKTFKKASEAIQTIITDGRDRAMNMFN